MSYFVLAKKFKSLALSKNTQAGGQKWKIRSMVSKEKVSYRADACDAFLCITMNTFYPHLCINSTEHLCYTNAETSSS